MGFGKIFDSTFTGSMVGSGPAVFAVWAYVIANTKPPGVVELNPVIIAAILGATLDSVQHALEVLTGPDERSRTKDYDGRRLIPMGEFCYEVPTWQKYRDARNDEERKAYNAEAQRKHREKVRAASNGASLTVNDNKQESAKADAEGRVQKEEAVPPLTPAKGVGSNRLPTSDQAKRIAVINHRRLDTPWSTKEIAAHKQLGKIPEEDLAMVEWYYAKNWPPNRDRNILRHDLGTFLNHFQGEVDRARNAKTKPQQKNLLPP